MNILILLVAALFPAILLWINIWRQDPQPEPTGQLVKAVVYGVAICIPAALIEHFIIQAIFENGPTTLFGTTVEAFFVAALPEEGLKLLALWLILRHNPYFDEHFDGIVYAVCIGLGFAAIENVSYIFDNKENWFLVAVTRSLLAVPAHYIFAVLMGYYYSIYHFVDHSPRTAAYILLIPVLAHGVYDAFALSGTVNPYIGDICFAILFFFCIKMRKVARAKIMAQIQKDQGNSDINIA